MYSLLIRDYLPIRLEEPKGTTCFADGGAVAIWCFHGFDLAFPERTTSGSENASYHRCGLPGPPKWRAKIHSAIL